MHNFDKSNNKIKTFDPTLEKFYKDNFGAVIVENVVNLDKQKTGLDKIITQKSGKKIYIEEKLRFCKEDYNDFLLEYYSDNVKKTPGWIIKDQFSDYIIYYVVEHKKIYALPTLLLQKAFKKFGKEWIRLAKIGEDNGYRISEAKNKNYITESVCVPKDVVFNALREVSLFTGIEKIEDTTDWFSDFDFFNE